MIITSDREMRITGRQNLEELQIAYSSKRKGLSI